MPVTLYSTAYIDSTSVSILLAYVFIPAFNIIYVDASIPSCNNGYKRMAASGAVATRTLVEFYQAATQKTVTFILATVRTSNSTAYKNVSIRVNISGF
jgi:flagellar biosynthesis protein FliP